MAQLTALSLALLMVAGAVFSLYLVVTPPYQLCFRIIDRAHSRRFMPLKDEDFPHLLRWVWLAKGAGALALAGLLAGAAALIGLL